MLKAHSSTAVHAGSGEGHALCRSSARAPAPPHSCRGRVQSVLIMLSSAARQGPSGFASSLQCTGSLLPQAASRTALTDNPSSLGPSLPYRC